MSKRNWTPQQMQAITARGGDLLVSAAAGSGKTAVLTERVISLITDPEHPLDIDHLLIVTFSNAAAAEMRQRIAARLYELIQEEPENAALRRQTLLLPNAPISTIHSFCFRLIRENFEQLGLPGDLRLADDREMKVLRQKVASVLLEEEYEAGDETFLRLVELLSRSRTDKNVQETILTLYEFIRNHPFYEQWTEKLIQEEENLDFDLTIWCRILKEYAQEAVEECVSLLEDCRRIIGGQDELENKVGPVFSGDLCMIKDFAQALEEESWDTCYEKCSALSFERFPRITNPEFADIKELVHEKRKTVSGIIGDLKKKVFLLPQTVYQNDITELHPIISRLFALILDFDRRFGEEKLLRGKLDYSDLEHYALHLLCGTEGKPTGLAARLAEQYAQILMDEYQATNELQETIFSAIAESGTSRFMVGDVKQSIYRFRQACPEIFLAKKQNYPAYNGKYFPARISLSANFRTRREITGFVNQLFECIMNPVVGEMHYLPEDALDSRSSFDYSLERPVSLLALDAPKDWNRDAVIMAEAERVAAEIDRLIKDGFCVQEGEQHRPAQPRDFCILMRAVKSKAEIYREALHRHGLTGKIDQKEGFLTSREITAILSYLKVLANPMLDMELATVLTSPLYGCTGDDIAKARITSNRGDKLFIGMQSESGNENPQFTAFMRDYEILRPQMQSEPCSRLIREICKLTAFEEKCRVLPDGDQRLSNLRLLVEYASDYEQGGRLDNDFIGYLSRLEEYGYDLPAAGTFGENAVSIMTVHRSKGLEFPIVFLVDLAGEFNREDQKADICLHRELGFACKSRNNRTMQQHKTLQFAAMQLENRRAALSEEMRILYVALTRPREKLYLVAAKTGFTDLLDQMEAPDEEKLSVWKTRSAGSFLAWLLPMFKAAYCDRLENVQLHQELLKEPERQIETELVQDLVPPAANPAMLQKLEENLSFQYPHELDTITPKRISVSELAEKNTREDFFLRRRPKILTAQGLSSTEQGTAAHKVMQFADYRALQEDPEREMRRLVGKGYLFREEGDRLDAGMIIHLLQSSLGRRLAGADHIYREIRFLQEFAPEELRNIDPSLIIGAKTVLMGAVDCVLIEQDKAIIIDYKTDRVREPEELLRRYTTQVRLYRAIVERQLGLPVTELYLYSFFLGLAIGVDL